MTLQEAIDSGRAFKRPNWSGYRYVLPEKDAYGSYTRLSYLEGHITTIDDVMAKDYELMEVEDDSTRSI